MVFESRWTCSGWSKGTLEASLRKPESATKVGPGRRTGPWLKRQEKKSGPAARTHFDPQRLRRWKTLWFGLLLGMLLPAVSCAGRKPALQPIAFSHRQHVAKKISCTFCHSGAVKYRQATIPSVTLCMSCHSVVKTDSPEIRKVKQYLERHEEIPWRPIYQLPKEADVFFNHHRHAVAGVECVTCHGDVGSRDVLTREVNHVMGSCVQCHRTHRGRFQLAALAEDCATCHR